MLDRPPSNRSFRDPDAPSAPASPDSAWRRFRRLALAQDASPDRLRRIVHAAPLSGFGQLLGFAVMTTYMADKAPAGLVIGWGAAIFALAVLLILRGRRVAIRARTRVSRRAIRRATILAIVAAAPWTALAIYAPLHLAPEHAMLPHVGFAGASAGGALILSGIPLAAFVYVGAIILPLVAVHLYLATGVSLLFAACALAYAALLCGFSAQHAAVLAVGEASERRLRDHMADLTDAHANIDRLARTDVVTGLMNRRALQEALARRLPQLSAPPGLAWPLYLIDLDHFKSINDACGHDIGDRYLREIAARLQQAAPEDAFIARLGGDEFAVFPQAPLEGAAVDALGARLIAEIARNVTFDGRDLKAGCSIGAALAPVHTREASELLRFADAALLEAKDAGRGRFVPFHSGRQEEFQRRTHEAAALARGLAENEIEMVYQPIFDLAERRLAGFEALARWRRGDRLAGPDEFLELAETQGLTLDLVEAIMRAIRRDATVWAAQGTHIGRLAINIHPAQLDHPDGLEAALDAIALLVGGRARVTLEITETCVTGRGAETRPARLAALAARGYRISLDDFGVGLAALGHVKGLPLAEIKIDRALTHTLPENAADMAIVKAMCDLAAPRGLDVVAEGVETHAQCAALASAGARLAQGHLFARPMAPQAVAAFVRAGCGGLDLAV